MHLKHIGVLAFVAALAGVANAQGKQIRPPVYPEGPYYGPKATHPDILNNTGLKEVFTVTTSGEHTFYPSVEREPNKGLTKPSYPPTIYVPPTAPPAVSEAGTAVNSINVEFTGIAQTALSPPDNTIAVGEKQTTMMVNSTLRITDKCGNTGFESTIQTWLNRPGSFIFDPKVMFDPWRRRWFQLWHEKNGNVASFILLASQQASAFGSYWVYVYDGETGGGTAWNDNYDIGYSSQGVFACGNQFTYAGSSFTTATFRTWDPTSIYNGTGGGMITDTGLTEQNGAATFAPRCAHAMYSNGDGLFASNRWNGGSIITVYKIQNPLGAHTIVRNDINVGAYALPPDAPQPSGFINTNDCRLSPIQYTATGAPRMAMASNVLTPQAGGGFCAQRLYIINPYALTVELDHWYWHSSGSAFYAAPAANYDDCINWGYSNCSTSTFARCAYTNFEPGTGFSNTFGVFHSGSSNHNSGRWGDYLQGDCDWGDYYYGGFTSGKQKVWMYSEFAAAAGAWGTSAAATQTVGQTQGTMNVTAGTAGFSGYAGAVSGSGGYTVSNSGQVSLQWQLSGLPASLTSDNFGDEIFAPTGSFSTSTVNISGTGSLQTLPYGHYTGNMTFTNCFNGATITRPYDIQVYGRANPTSQTINLGQMTAGSIANLTDVDGVVAKYCKAFVPNFASPRIQIQYFSTAPAATAGIVYFWVYAHMATAGSFSLRNEMWNFNIANWDPTDVVNQVINLSYAYNVNISSGVANRYIGGGNAVRSRVSLFQTGFSAVFVPCMEIDQAQWAFIAP